VILQMLSMGQLMDFGWGISDCLLWAKGMIRAGAVLLGVQVAIEIVGMMIGNHFLSECRVILSTAAIGWLLYPVTAYIHPRIGL
jgi:hypothetical protein